MILTLPRGNAKLPPQASPAHSGTCQHGLCCHTQVVHQFGCACMEAPKNELIWPMFSYHLILLTSFPSYQCLFGVFQQLGRHLSRPACSVLFSLCRLQLLYHENEPGETFPDVSWCWKEGPIRELLYKRRTLVWFFTASAAALIFSSNSQGNILGTQPLWHLKARVRIAVPSQGA